MTATRYTFRLTALSISTRTPRWGVFGGSEANLRLGLETLLGVLNASSRQGLNAELTRYTLSLMVLERKLAAAKGAMDTLGNRINGFTTSA
ncbi:High frequency lysogenization protein HflD [Kluyvera cryocrescens]|uniref:High frequency lysogenization protein HflD n=1 Tax=Kluyvera cryocrescens TaxID=580 RepID=A0A485CAW7_KLUCR|nr:High frequency lysogenization protein HflD [Kluyvera cryocrescens]